VSDVDEEIETGYMHRITKHDWMRGLIFYDSVLQVEMEGSLDRWMDNININAG